MIPADHPDYHDSGIETRTVFPHIKKSPGASVLQSDQDYYGCDDAYLYTTSDFTKAAIDMANELGVLLVRTEV